MKTQLTGLAVLTASLLLATALFAGDKATTQPTDAENQAAAPSKDIAAFQQEIKAKVAKADKANQFGLVGKDNWLFFLPELRAITVGKFWGEAAPKVSRASKDKYADPFEPIVDFNNQMKQLGVELIIVPVPAKASVYPEKLSDTVKPAKADGDKGDGSHAAPLPRVDIYHKAFYQELRKAGVTVLDPWPMLVQHRDGKLGPMYCRTDTHWSPKAGELTAEAIYALIQDRDWLKNMTKQNIVKEEKTIDVKGDLIDMVDEKIKPEVLPAAFIGLKTKDGTMPVPNNPDSPVILMGDSHTLVFHIADLHGIGAGLADHLAYKLGFGVDLIGKRGSGSSATRIDLYRRKDNFKGKKLIIWAFSVREFTESTSGWRKVPFVKQGG